MIEGGDRLQAEFEALNEAHGRSSRSTQRPPVTRWAAGCAHLSLDELPQMLTSSWAT